MIQKNTMHPVLEKPTARRASYQTRPVPVFVEFSSREQSIDTLEGPVLCHVGDAIVTGVRGERYPVPAGKFQGKFEPVKCDAPASSANYVKRLKVVEATQLHEALNLELPGGRGVLAGRPGDWCVWYGEADVAVVERDIFPILYGSDSVTVYVELGQDLSAEEKHSALQVIHSLDVSLSNTTVVYSEEMPGVASKNPIWFRIVKEVSNDRNTIPSCMELTLHSLVLEGASYRLVKLVSEACKTEGTWAFALRKFLKTISGQKNEADEASLAPVVARHLAAIDNFNAELKTSWNKKFQYEHIENRDEASEPPGLKKAYRIGAIADSLANRNQKKWQGLVFATTEDIAAQVMVKRFQSFPHTLVTLGLLAAVMLAAFSELGGGCDRNDPWGFELCASAAWAHWAKPFFFFAYLIALGSAWVRYARAKTGQWETRHQDYRLLAECIRILHVRALLGKPACVAADLPLAEPTDSGWVRLALRSIRFDAELGGMKFSGEAVPNTAQALKTFVAPQVFYHELKLLTRREKAIEKLTSASRLGLNIFWLVLFIVAMNVLAEAIFHRGFLSPMMDHVALILLVAGLGTWGGMRKVMDLFGLEQELQRGKLVLSYLAKAKKAETIYAISEAADYFLEDQSHWHALHRSKPIEAATGG